MVYEVDFTRLYSPSEKEMKAYNWHLRMAQFFGIGCDNNMNAMNGYMYSTYYTKYNSRRILTKVAEKSYLPCFLVTITPPHENKVITKVSLMFYYRHDSLIEQIEGLDSNLDLLPSNDCASFISINFNDKVCTPKTVVSNPLIPIKNYQKLSDIICRYTKIQNSLGYKNINAISIDGEPGLGKTSFMDYFSHNHRNDYQIIYIDMIKNYKTKFDEIYNNLLRIIESSGMGDMKNMAMPSPSMNGNVTQDRYDKGIVIMIDEIDKYVDMHIEFLHSTKKDTDDTDKEETVINANANANKIKPSKGYPKEMPVFAAPGMDEAAKLVESKTCHICGKEGTAISNCMMCGVPVHVPTQRESLCSILSDGRTLCISCGTKEMQYREEDMEYKELVADQEDDCKLIPQIIPCGRTGYYNPQHNPQQNYVLGGSMRPYGCEAPVVASYTTCPAKLYNPVNFNTTWAFENQNAVFNGYGTSFSNNNNNAQDDIPKSGKYFKKEIMYRLLDLINQKVKQPTYLIFCTNNFSSMWDDLNQRHFNHLKALKSRFIQIHFTRLDKPNLIDILRDINETFKKKLPEKYVEDEEFVTLTDKIPDDFQLTIRELHHLLIRSMYDLAQFTDLLTSEHLPDLGFVSSTDIHVISSPAGKREPPFSNAITEANEANGILPDLKRPNKGEKSL